MSPYLLWQLVDSAFPTGGFAHSGGLEAAWRTGAIHGDGALERYLTEQVEQAGEGALPFVGAAHDAPSEVAELDAICDASLTNHVANRASRAQGQAWVAATGAAFGIATLGELKAALRRGALAGHLAPIFGAVTRALDLPKPEVQRLFLFQHVRGIASSAVRLNLAGPMEAQAMLARMAGVVEATWARCQAIAPGDAAQSAPLLDLWQGHHDRLYSRLFSS